MKRSGIWSDPVKRVALTGGIGCGKSTLTEIFRELGCEIWDADDCVHALEAPGGRACADIADRFGPASIAPDGGVNRNYLAELIFSNAEHRQALHELLHPLVRAALDDWLSARGGGAARVKLAAIPLLYEVGWDSQWPWDARICVICPESRQIQRIQSQRDWLETDIRKRIAAQWPQSTKSALSDYLIDNSESITGLRRQAEQVLQTIMETHT
jgi:dephospho-CoA kinase